LRPINGRLDLIAKLDEILRECLTDDPAVVNDQRERSSRGQ
jgi:hypothetical protein